MIGKLKGRIDTILDDSLIVDVGGVGYLVFASRRLLSMLEPGHAAELIIETHVREDHIHLYGFVSITERDWFRTLTTVQGVGVRMALAIQGLYGPNQLHTIIAAQDKKLLVAVSGVGPKLAERIVTELKSKIGHLLGSAGATIERSASTKTAATAPESGEREDAISALVHLGYGRADAYSAVMKISAEEAASLDQLIKLALRELAR